MCVRKDRKVIQSCKSCSARATCPSSTVSAYAMLTKKKEAK